MSASARKSRRLPNWVRLSVSLALLAILLWLVDLRTVGSTLARAEVLFVLMLVGVVYAERIYSALRWYQVLRWSGTRVPLPVIIRISFIGAFAGLFLPGALGNEAIRVVGLARYSADLAMAFSSVLVDRMISVLTLVPLVLLGLALAPAEMPPGVRASAWVALGMVALLGFMLLHEWPRAAVEAITPRGLRPVLIPRLNRLYGAMAAYRRRPAMFALAMLMGFGFQFLRVLVVWLSALAVGIDVPAPYFIIFAPIIAFLGMLPISFASIGVREASYVYLFSLVGVAAEQAFAASILVQFTGLLSCLPGAVLYARGSRSLQDAGESGHACVRNRSNGFCRVSPGAGPRRKGRFGRGAGARSQEGGAPAASG